MKKDEEAKEEDFFRDIFPNPLVCHLVIFLISLLVRAAIAQGPFSGMGKLPIHGDFEAQRHWMEITLHLPPSEWYTGNHQWNNLQYWGLDYPPLTAYHSKLFGHLINMTTPEVVELGKSRGIETTSTKVWMRFSALSSDALTFIPAVMLLSKKNRLSIVETLLILLSPSLLLIDHGHFQFNCVAHGLVVFSLYFLEFSWTFTASVLFVLALNFKQMTLYYSPAIFVFLLKWSFHSFPLNKFLVLKRLILLGSAVILTFGIVFFPFLYFDHEFKLIFQVLKRIFPFERGLFEDKVANFWCSTNTFLKWRNIFSRQQLTVLSLAMTTLFISPACLMTLFPKRRQQRESSIDLRYCLFNVSLSFFLFSFQVHEKSILLPLVPALLLIKEDFFLSFSFSIFSAFSMVPLLIKDEILPTAFFLICFYCLLANLLKKEHFSNFQFLSLGLGTTMFVASSILILVATPPPKLPDLFVVIHTTISFSIFALFWLYGNWKQYQLFHVQQQVKQE